jgi:NTP pyrophosphatase (non-canonical NTP hydrolase)
MNLNDIASRHHEWTGRMGWNGQHTPLESLALVASEVGEAANEARGLVPTDKYDSEVADIILRSLHILKERGSDPEAVILAKMAANEQRGNKGRVK